MSESNPEGVLKKPRPGIYLLPNLLTTAALFAGFYAIVAAMQGHFVTSAEAIVVAFLLDSFDGRIARMTHTQTDFGVQYDSLSDLVSFGLAPALIMYLWSLSTLSEYGVVAGKIGWLAAFLYAACAALRLARFNTQAGVADKRFFQGLATPAAAGTMITWVWVCEEYGIPGHAMNWATVAVTVMMALLMVSNIRYISFKTWPRTDKVPFLWILALVLLMALLAVDTARVLMLVAYSYALSGPVFTLIGRSRRLARRSQRRGGREVDRDDASE